MALLAGTSSSAQTFIGPPAPVASPASAAYATAPIILDGQTLFSIAAPMGASAQLPVDERSATVNNTIGQVLANTSDDRPAYDPRTLRIVLRRDHSGDILQITDRTHAEPQTIVTVTAADAAWQHLSSDTVATHWQRTLQTRLVHAIVIREPRVQQRHLIQVGIAAAILLLLTLAGGFFIRRLGGRIATLGETVEQQQHTIESEQTVANAEQTGGPDEQRRRRTRSLLIGALRPTQRLIALRALRDLLIWTLLLGWCAGAAWAALLFPQTTPIGHTIVKNGLVIVSIFVVTGVIDRLLALAIGRLPAIWRLRTFANAEERERQTLRMPTIVRAMNGFKTFVLVFIAGLSALTQIGIPVGSVVTIGGVAAIAVSLATQNLIRDVVSGFLVLSEDQFVLGDFVTINGASGIVERLTLRMVQLRDGSGGLITISHSAATSVVNHSRNWSRVDYTVAIDAGADAANAIGLIESALRELYAENKWRNGIAHPIEWIGVDGLSRDGIVIRARIRTAPLQQFTLQRELNLRISRAFRDAQIAYGAPVPAVTPSN
jgi:small-conductance mechanosensitive channel